MPDPQSTTLPKNLRTGRIFEANVSSRFSTFFVHKYARFDKSTSLGLPTGAPFRLFHSQSDAFMQASCDPAKGVGRPQRSDGSSAHAPSFRVLSAGKTSSGLGESIADPTNPENHSAKGLWCLELPRRSESVAVTWGASFRVRHVASGRYLMVDAATGSGTSPSTGVQWFEARLVDEVNDSSSSNHPVSPNALLFRVQSAERAAASLIPAGECSVRIEHHYVDPKTGLDKVLYLHNTDLSRAPIEQLVAESSTVNESSSGGMAETSQITSGKMAPKRSLKLIFSTVRSAQDIFKVMMAPRVEVNRLRLIRSLLVNCNLYTVALSDPSRAIRDNLVSTVYALLRVILLCYKGKSKIDMTTDWVKKANSHSPAAFTALFGGVSDTAAQRACRDLKLMDTVFEMGYAVYARTFPADPWANSSAAFNGPRAIQKLVHVAIQLAISSFTRINQT